MADINDILSEEREQNNKLATEIEILLMESVQPLDVQMVALEIVVAKLITDVSYDSTHIKKGLNLFISQTEGFSLQFCALGK